jgi:hypothetical protein
MDCPNACGQLCKTDFYLGRDASVDIATMLLDGQPSNPIITVAKHFCLPYKYKLGSKSSLFNGSPGPFFPGGKVAAA